MAAPPSGPLCALSEPGQGLRPKDLAPCRERGGSPVRRGPGRRALESPAGSRMGGHDADRDGLGGGAHALPAGARAEIPDRFHADRGPGIAAPGSFADRVGGVGILAQPRAARDAARGPGRRRERFDFRTVLRQLPEAGVPVPGDLRPSHARIEPDRRRPRTLPAVGVPPRPRGGVREHEVRRGGRGRASRKCPGGRAGAPGLERKRVPGSPGARIKKRRRCS